MAQRAPRRNYYRLWAQGYARGKSQRRISRSRRPDLDEPTVFERILIAYYDCSFIDDFIFTDAGAISRCPEAFAFLWRLWSSRRLLGVPGAVARPG